MASIPTLVGRPSSLAQILVQAAETAPHTVIKLLSDHDQPVEISHASLLSRARHGAAALRAQGAEPGSKVALLLDDTADFLTGLWSAVYAGVVPVALAPVRNDAERWARYLAHVDHLLDHPLFIADPAYAKDLAQYRSINIETLDQTLDRTFDQTLDPDMTAYQPSLDDPALIVLTSGSTGNAKAVVLSHANLLASLPAKAKMHDLGPSDISLNWISFDHVAALIETHLLPLFVGAAQVHVSAAAILADPLLFLRLIECHKITMTFTPNFLLAQINAALQNEASSSRLDMTKLRHIVSGGEAVRVQTGELFLDLLKPCGLSQKALWPAFGMTETCAGSVYSRKFPELDYGRDFAALGHAIDGVALRIADEQDQQVNDGEQGELQLSGPVVFKGYHNNPEATAAAFTADGWFRSGDLGLIEQGRLRLVGRSKDSIIVSGSNYFSHELEAALEQLEGVQKSFVAAFATRRDGAETEQLVVAFATRLFEDAQLFRLIVAIRNATILLWGFRPAAILPLKQGDFPKTSLGKIQRASLRRTYESGGFVEAERRIADIASRQLGAFVPAATDKELRISHIYAQILHSTEISITASFFDLGGTSLDILKLKKLVEQEFGLDDLPVLAILQHPTVQELATHLGRLDGPYDPVVTLQSSGSKTPLFVVHPGVGEVLVFVNLAQYFVGERPFHALRARGFNKGEPYFTQFSEMVQTYVDAIRRRQPRGPFALAGYSYGGAVAFEIAKALESEGEKVDFVGIFNLPPHIKYRMDELDLFEGAVNLAFFLSLIDKKQSQELPAWLRARPEINHNEWLIRQAPRERLAELDIDIAKFTAWADLAQSLLAMGRTYHPSGSVESLSVFYAIPLRGSREDWLANELRRWDDFSRSGNRYIEVAGEHYTMMSLQHVASFQAILREELDRALHGN